MAVSFHLHYARKCKTSRHNAEDSRSQGEKVWVPSIPGARTACAHVSTRSDNSRFFSPMLDQPHHHFDLALFHSSRSRLSATVIDEPGPCLVLAGQVRGAEQRPTAGISAHHPSSSLGWHASVRFVLTPTRHGSLCSESDAHSDNNSWLIPSLVAGR